MRKGRTATRLFVGLAAALCGCGSDQLGEQLPVARAGFDQSVMVGGEARLSGEESSDPSGRGVQKYQWSIVAQPSGSDVSLVGAQQVDAWFTPELAGQYLVSLVVKAGNSTSVPDLVLIRARGGILDNRAPHAVVGCQGNHCEVGHGVGELQLAGGQSWDPDGDTLTFSWSQVTSSSGCATCAELETCDPVADPVSWQTDTDVTNPSFMAPNAVGPLVFRLDVSDDSAATDTACVVVESTNSPPIALINLSTAPNDVNEGVTFRLDGTYSSDSDAIDRRVLTYEWTSESVGSVAVTFDPNPPTSSVVNVTVPNVAADVDVTFRLTVSDPFDASACNPSSCGAVSCCAVTVRVHNL